MLPIRVHHSKNRVPLNFSIVLSDLQWLLPLKLRITETFSNRNLLFVSVLHYIFTFLYQRVDIFAYSLRNYKVGFVLAYHYFCS